MRHVLLSTVLVPLTLGGLALPASAACVLSTTPITCTGASTGFTRNSDFNNLNIVVEEGATVTRGNNDTIRIRGNGNTVTNKGTIIGNGPATEADRTDAIDGGNDLTVYNYGQIKATNKAIDAELKNGLKVVNEGTITALDKAIRNQDGQNAYLENRGLIESETDEGFESGNNAKIVNHGTIRASDDAIQIGENAFIENYGLIESVLRGADDAADPQDGIDIDSGYVMNAGTGVIRSDDDAAIDFDASEITSYIENRGRISGTTGILVEKGETGEAPNVASQVISNWGVIEGRNGLAVDLGAGNDVLTLYTGATLIGGADFGADDDSLILDGSFDGLIAGGSLLDGGTGFDTFSLLGFGFGDLVSAIFGADEAVSLSFLTGTSDFTVNLINWESFAFADKSFSFDELRDATTPAPVPVPAAGLMLIGGLAGLAALRRRRG